MRFEDIDALHRKITRAAPYAANRIVAVLSKCSPSRPLGHAADNPGKGSSVTPRQAQALPDRRRVGAADQGAGRHPDQEVANIFRLLLLTGARRGEVLPHALGGRRSHDGIWSKAGQHDQAEDRSRRAAVGTGATAAERKSAAADRQEKVLPEFVFPGARQSGMWSRSRSWAPCARPRTSPACASTTCGIVRQSARQRRRVAAIDRRAVGSHPTVNDSAIQPFVSRPAKSRRGKSCGHHWRCRERWNDGADAAADDTQATPMTVADNNRRPFYQRSSEGVAQHRQRHRVGIGGLALKANGGEPDEFINFVCSDPRLSDDEQAQDSFRWLLRHYAKKSRSRRIDHAVC